MTHMVMFTDDSLLIIDAADGDLLQQIKLTHRNVVNVCWTPFQPQLTLLDISGDITQFEVEYPSA